MRKLFGLMFALLFVGIATTAKADVMDVNVTLVDPRYQSAFINAERFWESRIIGYSDALPVGVRAQLSKLRITASTVPIDGFGGTLGQAGVTSTVNWGGFVGFPRLGNSVSISIATQATMQFDTADMAGMQAAGTLDAVIRHEMAHAMGFGSLWAGNRLLANTGFGLPNYIGKYGVKEYRKETGQTLAPFVPVEQQGGPGTAGSHWEDGDTFFNQINSTGRTELMLGSINAFNPATRTFVSETTWGQFADLWFKVKGIAGVPFNDFVFGGGGTGPVRPVTPWTPRGPGGGVFPGGIQFLRSVPEPSTFGVLALGSLLMFTRRRK